jgi:hypothetical protein
MSINEAATIQTTSINAITPTTGTLSVGDTQTTGVLNVGTGVRTSAGVMNIATGSSNACAINIMNGNTTAGSVNIANGTGSSQTTAVNISSGSTTGAVTIGGTSNTTTLASSALLIGNNSSVTNMFGYVNLARNTSGTKNTYIETNSLSDFNFIDFHSSGLFDVDYDSRIFTKHGSTASGQGTFEIISNNLLLNNNTVTVVGTTNIATATSSNATINMLNGGSAAGSVNIANGTGASQTTAVNIGTGSTTGTVTIGNTDNTVQINGALTMGTNKNITLKTDGVAPTSGTQLGGLVAGTLSTLDTLSGAILATLDIDTPGVYMFVFNFFQNTTSKGQTNSVILSGVGTQSTRFSATVASSASMGFNGVQVVNATASTYNLTLSSNSTFGTNKISGFFNATRIG